MPISSTTLNRQWIARTTLLRATAPEHRGAGSVTGRETLLHDRGRQGTTGATGGGRRRWPCRNCWPTGRAVWDGSGDVMDSRFA